jgi:Protein of unknown function (DUF3224)
MPRTAKSSFVIDKKTPNPISFEGGQMTHTRFEKTFTGDIVGTSVVEALLAGLDNGGPAIYVGIERFDCTVGGAAGDVCLDALGHPARRGRLSVMDDRPRLRRWPVGWHHRRRRDLAQPRLRADL